jgi:3-methyladenine DNA glycosylase AlkD
MIVSSFLIYFVSSMNEQQVFSEILMAYEAAANPKKAEAMSAYMRDQFVFLGISAPDRLAILQPILKGYHPDAKRFEWLLSQLWEQEAREFHYAAIVIAQKNKRIWQEKTILLFEDLLTRHSWWDTVDVLCSQCVGPILMQYPQTKMAILNKWESSSNMWLNRASIIHQLLYKTKTDTDYLTHVIQLHADSNLFFIQKAIGWALKQYARTQPDWVINFVNTYPLKPLSKREALKHLKSLKH